MASRPCGGDGATRRLRRRGWTTSGGAQLPGRGDSECDEDEQQDELLHGPKGSRSLASAPEVSGDLVAPTAFKAAGRSDPATAGSIPVHLRQTPTLRICRPIAAVDPQRRGELDGEEVAGAGV